MILKKRSLKPGFLFCISLCLMVGIFQPIHSSSQPRILVDISHSHENANTEINFTMLPVQLSQFTFEISDERLTPSLLEEYQVLLFYQPYAVLDDSEIEAVTAFIEKGGGVLMCGDHYLGWERESIASYNKLISQFGISFTPTVVDDPTNKQGCTCTPIIHNLEEHSITENISQIVLYSPCNLIVSGDAQPLARGDEDTIMKGNTKTSGNVQGEDIIVAAVSEYGSGRIVAIGSYTLLTNSLVNEPDNLLFVEHCILWASEHSASTGDRSQWYIPVAVGVIVCGLLIAVYGFKKREKSTSEKK
ncbi:MAG: hypothetical protein HXS53_09435 [Theionarchaea archaeon]|nr:hypothetical protein [Theionarchaea archaeon]